MSCQPCDAIRTAAYTGRSDGYFACTLRPISLMTARQRVVSASSSPIRHFEKFDPCCHITAHPARQARRLTLRAQATYRFRAPIVPVRLLPRDLTAETLVPRDNSTMAELPPHMRPERSFQGLILALQRYWAEYGCVILQPYDMEVGAGTFHPATTLRALGPNAWN